MTTWRFAVSAEREAQGEGWKEEAEPKFQETMTLEEVERFGGCKPVKEADPVNTHAQIEEALKAGSLIELNEQIVDTGSTVGEGPGFPSDVALSPDEQSVILDLEDEWTRTGQFDPIFPVASVANKYYGLSTKRYQNALYCAWLSTPEERRQQLLN